MASIFFEPGGDATFNSSFWPFASGGPAVATDFVHGGHIKSIKYRPGNADQVGHQGGIIADAGGRVSFWVYLTALPTNTVTVPVLFNNSTDSVSIIELNITSAGVLQLLDNTDTQMGSNGATLSTGVWYRLCLAWKITSTTVNEIKLFVNGTQSISLVNVTLSGTGLNRFYIGNTIADATLDFRTSDHYFDDSNSVTDTGNVWVTAKRTFSNGTTNGMTGSGTPSGYGSGNARYVNERPNSDSNFVSVVGAGSAITEEYNIESVSQGDIDITGATIVDYMGWLRSKALLAETASLILNNVTSNISLTSTTAFFTKIAGSTTYPAGTGTDIGEITSTTATTVSLYECGILFAYIPAAATTSTSITTSTSTTSTSSSTTTSTSKTTSTSTTSTSSSTSITTSTSSSTSITSTSSSTSKTTSTSTSTTSTSSSTSITSSTSTSSTTTSSSTSTTTSTSTSTTSTSSSTSQTTSTSTSSTTTSTSSSTSQTTSTSTTSTSSSTSQTISTSTSTSTTLSTTTSTSSTTTSSSTSISTSTSTTTTIQMSFSVERPKQQALQEFRTIGSLSFTVEKVGQRAKIN